MISRLKPLTQHYFDSAVAGALTNNYVEKLFCYLFILGTIQRRQPQIKTRGLLVRVTGHVYIINCNNESDKSVILYILYSQLNLSM